MQSQFRSYVKLLVVSAGLTLGACGGHTRAADTATAGGEVGNAYPATTPADSAATASRMDTTTYKHHSKLGGALVGAAAGHMLGGHAVAGAAAGALIQHERNKHHH